MTPDQRLLLVGGYICSGLYLSGGFVASLFVQHGEGWKIALLSMGMATIGYAAQLMQVPRHLQASVVACSWVAGIAAGICVLIGV